MGFNKTIKPHDLYNPDEILEGSDTSHYSEGSKWLIKEYGWNIVNKDKRPPRPNYDYANWEHKPRTGVRGANGQRMTKGLFLESFTKYPTHKPWYTMQEYTTFCPHYGVWLPSAHQIYIHSADEYDAMLKLVGNAEQWNRLLDCSWFVNGKDDFCGLKDWRAEMELRKRSQAEGWLWDHANKGSLPAAKELFNAYNKQAKGRPLKPKEKVHDQGEADIADLDRIAKVVDMTKYQKKEGNG